MESRFQGTNETLTCFIRVIVDFLERLDDHRPEREVVFLIKRLMHPDYRKALVGMPSDTLDQLKSAAPHAQELIKSYRSYRLPPTTGLLEPSLAWKPVKGTDTLGPKVTERTATTQIDLSRAVPKLHFEAVDPYLYYHSKPQKEVRFQPEGNAPLAPTQRARSPSPGPISSTANRSASPRSMSPERREMRCFICNSPSNLARNCPSRSSPGASTTAPRQPNANMLIDYSSSEEIATVALADRDKKPYMKVSLLSKEFMAYLDTGSSVSVLGDDIIAEIERKSIRCKESKKVIRFLKGDYIAHKCVTLTVNYYGNTRRHNFLLVQGTIRTILLGRDFLGPANIGVFIGLGGWIIGLENQRIVPFEILTEPFLSIDYKPDAKGNGSYSAEILALFPNVAEETKDDDSEVRLFPTKSEEYSCLKVPVDLSEEERNSLRETLHEFLHMCTVAPGKCSFYKHTVNTGSHQPISASFRPMSPGKQRIFDESFLNL